MVEMIDMVILRAENVINYINYYYLFTVHSTVFISNKYSSIVLLLKVFRQYFFTKHCMLL